MLVPGTTMDISLKSGHIDIVDTGVVKRVKYCGRTYADVLSEIQRFAYLRGYNTPPAILKFIMKRVGLPDTESFSDGEELTREDILELSRTLSVVESLKDKYLSPLGKAELDEEIELHLPINPEVPEGVEATPVAADKATIWDTVPNSDEANELIVRFHMENIPKEEAVPPTEAPVEVASKPRRFVWDEPPGSEAPIEETSHISVPTQDESGDVKVIILGEQQVGVKSILYECGMQLGTQGVSDDLIGGKPFVYSTVVCCKAKKVHLNAWPFEKVQEARVPRTEFFAGTGVAVIVYSVADRWSYDSLDFWTKEVVTAFPVPPPIIIVGNKTDLREHPVITEDEPEPPVTKEEGAAYCERIAQQLGTDGQPHPVSFIETSSVTRAGIHELMQKIAELWLENESISMPALEPQIA
jgi:GTPase SAR1 family protein